MLCLMIPSIFSKSQQDLYHPVMKWLQDGVNLSENVVKYLHVINCSMVTWLVVNALPPCRVTRVQDREAGDCSVV